VRLQAKLQGIREEMERSKQEEEERWHKRMEAQRAWKADMDVRILPATPRCGCHLTHHLHRAASG
jgi:hypothetical protein